MSLPKVTGTAKLLTDPKKALTKTGKPMATVLLKFVGWRKDDDGKWVEGDHVIAAAIAFEDVARDLAGFAKGDDVEVEGVATVAVWNDRPQLNLTLRAVVAAVKKAREPVAA